MTSTIIPDIGSVVFTNGQPSIPTSTIVAVTPEMAADWLDRNDVNRNVRDKRVAQFARDMVNGNWRLTGESIKFGKSGRLLDGQHRLWAVVSAGVPVRMFVVHGLDDDTQGVIDSGSARTAADNLSMAGYKNAQLVASIARRRISLTDFNNVTNTEVHEYVEQNPEITVAAEIARRHAHRCDIVPSTAALAAWRIAEEHDWETAESFFQAAADKVGLRQGDPVLAMTAFFTDQKLKRRKLDLSSQLSVIIRTFNARRAGKPMRVIKVNSPSGGVVPIPPVSP